MWEQVGRTDVGKKYGKKPGTPLVQFERHEGGIQSPARTGNLLYFVVWEQVGRTDVGKKYGKKPGTPLVQFERHEGGIQSPARTGNLLYFVCGNRWEGRTLVRNMAKSQGRLWSNLKGMKVESSHQPGLEICCILCVGTGGKDGRW